ncbi:hypothetical protein PHYSODRAFT_318565 [Phytophthora sojae]|uniref:Thiolase N-terminal domain-containing protein n=1 Tax=Phytophthora sojae (strain P6497) TaxID=1094619 RepID=G5A404_PHYSP|nr:hypothetical protein PHYSODRAFT_318565 [Phytophthora sojae]EGZ10264.1 hypothetical protein PHYSODRAFT_318565 [Phytophthora sojae]|eukprot:XP_009535125.1 hypothetical protein PHYSODRAFT_318565 [Phytophthora sojae]
METEAPSRDVCIVGVARRPCGSLQGKRSALKASDLAGVAIKEALSRVGVQPTDVEELILGHVISAGAGQAPTKQAAVSAGLPQSVVCSSVNKVCASGMKAVMLGAQSIMLGQRDVVVVGGMERKLAVGRDTGTCDGLFNAFENIPMGDIAEECARKHDISREAQDAYAAESYP